MRRFLTVAVLVVTIMALTAAGAGADPPERTTLRFDVDQVLIDDFTCPFPFEERVEGHVIITTFFDKEGNPTRTQINVAIVGEATNPATGKTLRAVQANLFIQEPSTRVTAGLRFLALVPGGGVVLLDAGRVVVVDGQIEFEAGQHQLISGDVEEFCGFLGG